MLNAGKDYVLEQLRDEREGWLQRLLESSHRVGELENMLRLEPPKRAATEQRRIPVFSEDEIPPLKTQ